LVNHNRGSSLTEVAPRLALDEEDLIPGSSWERELRTPFRRVVIVSHSSNLYGAGRSMLELSACLAQRAIRVGVVVSAEGSLAKELRDSGHEVWCIPLATWVGHREDDSHGLAHSHARRRGVVAVSRILSEWGAEVVWTNSSVTPIGALAAQELGLPHIWHLRELNGSGCEFRFSDPEQDVVSLLKKSVGRIAVSGFVKEYYQSMGCGDCHWIYNGIGSRTQLEDREQVVARSVWRHAAARITGHAY
jgi:hypothetical protein